MYGGFLGGSADLGDEHRPQSLAAGVPQGQRFAVADTHEVPPLSGDQASLPVRPSTHGLDRDGISDVWYRRLRGAAKKLMD